MIKIWWEGEPMMVGGLRWRIVQNDLLNNMRVLLVEYRQLVAWQDKILIPRPRRNLRRNRK